MPTNPLSLRVVLLSLGVAFAAWPLVWCLLAVAQGVGVLLAGGDFIGLSLPLGQYPWALVNQPTINFSSTTAGLWGYWLSPLVFAFALAIGLPVFAPGPRAWSGELVLLHFALASTVLGFGWAPAFGVADGPARGLERFFHTPWPAFLAGCAVLGAVAAVFSLVRLAGSLWHDASPLSVGRRLLVVLLHGLLPALVWIGLAIFVGWRPAAFSLAGVGAVLLGPFLVLLLRIPRATLERREAPPTTHVLLAWVLGLALLALAGWAGAPARGTLRGYLWAAPKATNNLRPDWVIVPLRSGLVKPGQGARGWVP